MRLLNIDNNSSIAYFSMEIGLDAKIPTYSGGLGILAGDTLRSAADLSVPMVAITLLQRKGYFKQKLGKDGSQSEEEVTWEPKELLDEVKERITVYIEGREVVVGAWRHTIEGVSGGSIPVYFLDTDLKENSDFDRSLTGHLYGGDDHYRLCQEVILGIGGVAMLSALGYDNGTHYHMNEGHSALLTVALLTKETKGRELKDATVIDIEAVSSRCIFTTHTPVPAGHDQFGSELSEKVLGTELISALKTVGCLQNNSLNMTFLALFFSRYINGVAMRHGAVSRTMFPEHPINAITNGVHATTWTAGPFRRLFDERTWGWRTDNLYLRYAIEIPLEIIKDTHSACKAELFTEVEARTGVKLDPEVITLGIARRATPYKRLDLILSDSERLREITKKAGPLQIIYSGKAHPKDMPGKETIKRIFKAIEELKDDVKIVYLENYEIGIAKKLCAGVDLWINTPLRPREASGTSGMKAAMNGVPSFSTHDGWWVEGHIEGITGWVIGREEAEAPEDHDGEVKDMYDKLEKVILPLFYNDPLGFAKIQRSTIAFNASFFNTQRMVSQYISNAYFPVEPSRDGLIPVEEKL